MAAVPADAPMPVVIPLVGLPGAGKTTLADALARAFGLRTVSRDVIRDALFPECRYTPTEQRAVLLMRAEGDLTLEEIAATVGTGRETIKSRLRYALAKLREGLRAP